MNLLLQIMLVQCSNLPLRNNSFTTAQGQNERSNLSNSSLNCHLLPYKQTVYIYIYMYLCNSSYIVSGCAYVLYCAWRRLLSLRVLCFSIMIASVFRIALSKVFLPMVFIYYNMFVRLISNICSLSKFLVTFNLSFLFTIVVWCSSK